MTPREFEKLNHVEAYRISSSCTVVIKKRDDNTLWAARLVSNKIKTIMQVQRMPDGSIETIEVKNG